MLKSTNMCVVFIILVSSLLRNSKSEYPYGTKTPYDPGNLQTILEPTGCTAVHLNMVIRHGSRYPCTYSSVKILDFLKKINKLHESKSYTYKNLTLPWNLPNNYHVAGNCEQSDVGDQEIYDLAKRFKEKYPRLFVKKYWNKFYHLITSDTPRTARSAAAFGYGLFESNGTVGKDKYQPLGIIFSGPKDKDKVLRYYNTCPRYNKAIQNDNQWRTFGASYSMKIVIKNIEKRLQLKGKMNVSDNSAQFIYRLCAFGTMNHGNREWCSVLTKEDLEVLEYYDDIQMYYRHSYGNEISYKTNCPLVADILNSLKMFVSKNRTYPYGIFRFTHIGTVTALQSIIGMYNDSLPLKANNFKEKRNRTFRISKNVPMSANMAFVLYKCSKEFKIQILMNENPAVLPCCDNGSVCSFKTFLSCYEAIGKNCDFDAMCQDPAPTKVSASQSISVGWFSVVLVVILVLL